MKTRTKKFDCVAMKNRIQGKLMAEFEARKGEFDSYADFVVASVREHDWCRRQLERISHGSRGV